MSNDPPLSSLLDNDNQEILNKTDNEVNIRPNTLDNLNENNNLASDNQQHLDRGITSTLLLAVIAAISGTSFHFGYASGVL
ncbi:unnamed protein product [Rotaria socialis]|nr:unnamed protein product [Rotaria socialis]